MTKRCEQCRGPMPAKRVNESRYTYKTRKFCSLVCSVVVRRRLRNKGRV